MKPSKSQHRHKIKALTLLAMSAIGLVVCGFEAYKTNHDDLWAVVIALACITLPDRIADVFASFMEDKEDMQSVDEREKMVHLMNTFFGNLPAYLLSAHDIVAFPTRQAGLEHCIYLSKHACQIRNTALRYKGASSLGNPQQPTEVDQVYLEWIDAKKATLEKGYIVSEIISRYFAPTDPMRTFAEAQASRLYHHCKIDDAVNPMVQVTIFDFSDKRPSEVVLGWDIPGQERGLSFASRHGELVSYFEAYFNHNYAINTKTTWSDHEPTSGDDSPSPGRTASDGDLPVHPGNGRAAGLRSLLGRWRKN